MSTARLYWGVALVSAGVLLYETALTRVLSFTIWHHFAYVVLGTALLGFGASGTYLAVRSPPSPGEPRGLANAALASGITGAAFLVFVSCVSFDPLRVFDQAGSLATLFAYLIGASVPFFFAGIAISRALASAPGRVHTVYAWDLAGAGAGCVAAIVLMDAWGPPAALVFASGLMAAAASVFGGGSAGRGASVFAVLCFALSAWVTGWLPFETAASKHLSQYLTEQRMTLVDTRWNSLFRTDITRSTRESRWGNADEWGLSPKVTEPVQSFWGIITHDGSAGVPLYDRRAGKLEFLDSHLLKVPYLVAPKAPKVLVIGVGGGRDIFTALRYGASHVTGVELDRQTVDFVRGSIADLARDVFEDPKVDLQVGEGRHFIERSRDKYDVIQITGVDTLAAQTSGAYVLAENFLYTVEAFHAYLDHLKPGGIVSIATGEWQPDEPQITGRMAMVAREALTERNLEPSSRIALFHSNHLLTEVIVRAEPFTPEEIRTLEEESARLGFLNLWLPNRPSHAAFSRLMQTQGEEHDRVLSEMRYVVDPVSDERPFFFRFHRWSQLLRASDFGPFLASALGQLLLVVLTVSLTALSALFTLVPLALFRRRGVRGGTALGVLVYFLALGFGFMAVEVSLIQRFVLYLGYPTYSLSVSLFTLLTATGAGSFLSKRFAERERSVLPAAVAALLLLLAGYRFGLPVLMSATLGAPLALRVLLTIVVLFPVGIVAGIFFPTGIHRVSAIHPDLVAWAWGVNGCASVVGSVLGVILAMEWGFDFVTGLAAAAYVVGTAAFVTVTRESQRHIPSPA